MNFHIADRTLTIQLQGMERVLALKKQITVDKLEISDIQWHEILVVPRSNLGWRFGTAIPGGLFAGRFTSSLRNFLYVQKTRGLFGEISMQNVLVIDLKDANFDRLYLTMNDPDMATRLVAWNQTA